MLRAVMASLVTAWVLALVVVSVVEERRNVGRLVGIGIEEVEGGLRITRVTPGGAADRAGIQAEDLLNRIDGQALSNLFDYDEAARDFDPRHAAVFSLRRSGVDLELPVVPGTEFEWTRFVVSKLAVLGYLSLGLLALFKMADDLRARLLFIFSIAVAVELSLPDVLFGPAWWAAASRAAFVFISGFEMGVELHLASVIPRRQRWLTRYPWVVPAYYVLGCGFGLVSAVVLVAETMGSQALPVDSGHVYWVLNTILLPFWAVAVTFLITSQALRFPEPEGRHQAGLVLVGVAPWAAYTLMQVAYPDAVGLLGWFADPLQSLILLCYPIAIFFAIARFHLFDIELVVRRGLLYTLLAAVLVVLFFTFVGAGGTLLSTVASETSVVWVASAATLLLGLLFSPIRGFVQQLVDRRFFPERYALRKRLIALAEELPALGKLPKMGDYLATTLGEIFGVSSVTLLIGDPATGVLTTLAATGGRRDLLVDHAMLLAPDDPGVAHLRDAARPTSAGTLARKSIAMAQRLQALDTTLVVPVNTHRKLIGILLLGHRDGSDRFPAEEIELLSLVSHLVATTFENARLFESATYEALTGLLRRESILERLEDEVSRALRYERPLTVGMADLDRFKLVNDRFGHLSGDAVLKRVAQTISKGLRTSDAVGRYGGEEFLIVLPETDREAAVAVAEKIRTLVEGAEFLAQDGSQVAVTVSIGLASLDEVQGSGSEGPQDLIAVADSRLYAAKESGRNRVEAKNLAAS